MKAILTGVLLLAAGILGFVLGGHFRSRPPIPLESSPDSGQVERLRAEVARLERALEEARRIDPAPAQPPAPSSRPGLEERAERIRKAALERAENAEQIASAQLAAEEAAEKRRAEEERRRLEDAARGGTMALLRSLEKDWVAPWTLLGSREELGKRFVRRAKGPDLVDPSLLAGAPDGSTLYFPAGRHSFPARALRHKSLSRDLRIVGQGMDATLLVLDAELDIRGEVDNLGFQDLTIHTNNNYLECFRSAPYTLRLVRCRVIGFDTGAAGGDMLSGSTGAFYATDCRFESGYGRSPGHGMLFDVRGALLARLEGCTIRGPLYTVFNSSSRSAVVFSSCRFLDMVARTRSQFENPRRVRLEDCTVSYAEPDAKAPRRSLEEINRGWKKRPR
jgi:hypothetical protein